MANSSEPLASRVHASFRQLSATASHLNSASDELGKLISEIETALKNINLGVEAWVRIENEEDPGGNFTNRDVGYVKLSKGWCIALRSTSGNHNYDDPDNFERETWSFNEGPRWLRIKAVEELPALLNQLNHKAEELTNHVSHKLADAAEVAKAIKAVVETAPSKAAKK